MWVEVCRVEILHLGRDCVLFPGSQGQILFFSPGCWTRPPPVLLNCLHSLLGPFPPPPSFLPLLPTFSLFLFPSPLRPSSLPPSTLFPSPPSSFVYCQVASGSLLHYLLTSFLFHLSLLSPSHSSPPLSPLPQSCLIPSLAISSLPTTDVREGEMETPAEFPTPIPPSRKGAASECPGMHQPSSAITDVSMSQH